MTANILDSLGVTREKVREASARLFEPAVIADGAGRERRVVGDGEAEQATAQARRSAARRGQSRFRSEHVLFCLADDSGCSARRVLNDAQPPQIQIPGPATSARTSRSIALSSFWNSATIASSSTRSPAPQQARFGWSR
ncbi:Clp protease N-terminal domain-containing protein [Actinocorallia herbida]|uniref:Clp protease N-terminal domain-containing protein n=1 Tax=Actinocorallia herbida TaxID=58109 RepID=UPI0014773312|nr:Clp protease N-terminal domain-containing protein [Actinocorallia herbida]